jgi:superfamily I DNA and/or RNA helicase
LHWYERVRKRGGRVERWISNAEKSKRIDKNRRIGKREVSKKIKRKGRIMIDRKREMK